MAALRKKYQGRADIDPVKKADDAPVSSVPPARASMPPVDNSPSPEDLSVSAQSDPAEEAGQNALKERLAELERAQAINQQPQPPQFAEADNPEHQTPLERMLSAMPEAARPWLAAHADYLTDPELNAALQHGHWVARRESGEEYSPRYFERMEVHLGLRPERQPQQPRVVSRPSVPRQTSVSAPPHRESVSLSTGRPTGDRVRLTGEEREFAAMLGLSEADYAQEKQRMLRTQQ